MGLFDKFRNSASKSHLIQTASQHVQAGQLNVAVQDIFSFYQSDEAFKNILAYFKATPKDIEEIIIGLMFSGAGVCGKHFVPVSAVLFHDTLAYLLRVERGQVQKTQAYFEVQEYFRSGAIVFEPERTFH